LSEILPSSALGPGSGNLSQNGQKHTPFMTWYTKKPTPPIFFHCRFENLPHLLRVWTAL